MLSIETKDGKIVKVSQEIRGMAIFINETLLDGGEEVEIKASEHNEKEVLLVVKYCQHHKWAKTETDLEIPLPSRDPNIYIKDEFDRAFITALNLD